MDIEPSPEKGEIKKSIGRLQQLGYSDTKIDNTLESLNALFEMGFTSDQIIDMLDEADYDVNRIWNFLPPASPP